MANQARKASTWAPNSNLASNDSVCALTTSQGTSVNNVLVTVGSLLGNSNTNHVITNTNYLVVQTGITPANSIALGNTVPVGSLWSDGTFIYYADAVGHVKRMGSLANF